MLKRLFLYDFTALYRRLIRSVIAVLIASLVSLGILLLSGLIPATAAFATALNNALTVVFYALILTFAVLFIFCISQLFIYFYQSIFGEEGAFVRTIPVPADTLLHAKLLAGGLWTVILLCLGVVAVALGALLPFEMLLRAENVSFLSNLARTISDELGIFTLPALLLSLLSKLAVSYFAVSLGATLFPKRSMLGAILLFVLFLAADITLHLVLTAFTAPAFEWEGGFVAHLPDMFSMLLSLLLGTSATLGARALFMKHLSLYY